jgi:hypothetical protein
MRRILAQEPARWFFVARVPRGHLVAARPSRRPRLSKVKIRLRSVCVWLRITHAYCETSRINDPRRVRGSAELVGKAVVLTDGKAGTVENVWLDELHGLRLSIESHDGKWPISTIKFAQP